MSENLIILRILCWTAALMSCAEAVSPFRFSAFRSNCYACW